MLELVQSLLESARGLAARSNVELALQSVAGEYGFRSAIILEYGPTLKTIASVVDSDPCRRPKWTATLDTHVVVGCVALTSALAKRAPVSRFDASYFAEDPHCLQAAEELDVLEGVAVPILHHAKLSGVVKFAGAPSVSEAGLVTLHTAAHLMYSAWQNARDNDAKGFRLTPREKQVMQLTAQGHTTPETASILGMSERTVNQHTENVAGKLGTRNRVHTVASLVRLNLM
ncbi:DNA-binding transcriptional regulator, CsgD family [Devosia sp. YR412]|uniref:helix-turn-helix transcriptional regulator n=1 Tax=Devosia sp. YR412 TaxID=1881030 RepID=UPI0008B3FF04|nr:LuxR family transcriptional regulator [Devosia sp. YR412]SEP97135.1 DNA-binding transcriptional regulator, CsgD family [Devosia sp. YR412]